VFVDRRREYGIESVDNVVEINRKVSVELRVDNITLDLRDTDRLRHLKDEVDNGG